MHPHVREVPFVRSAWHVTAPSIVPVLSVADAWRATAVAEPRGQRPAQHRSLPHTVDQPRCLLGVVATLVGRATDSVCSDMVTARQVR